MVSDKNNLFSLPHWCPYALPSRVNISTVTVLAGELNPTFTTYYPTGGRSVCKKHCSLPPSLSVSPIPEISSLFSKNLLPFLSTPTRTPHFVSPMVFICFSALAGPAFRTFLIVRPMVDMARLVYCIGKGALVVFIPRSAVSENRTSNPRRHSGRAMFCRLTGRSMISQVL